MGTENKKGLLSKAKEHKILTVIVILITALIIFRLLDFGLGLFTDESTSEAMISVKTDTAQFTSISKVTPLSGRISPVDEAAIFPLAAGNVTRVNVKVGDYVKSGTVLFEIDKGTISTSYNQAKAAYDLAKTTIDNMTMLYQEGAISKSDFDSANMSYINAKEAFKAVQEQYSNFNVTTPISGYVTSLNVSVGNLASSSQMAASVANTDALQIETTVSEYIAGIIKINDEVDVYVESLGDKAYSGTITAFSPVPALGTLTYPVTITLDNEEGDLISGMFAEVKIKAEEVAEAVCISSDAVIMKNGISIVVVLDDENIPTFKEVTLGIDNGEMVEITSGIKEGDVVVVSGQSFVTEGVAVNVIE